MHDPLDRMCKWAIAALREGDSPEFVANVLELVTLKLHEATP